MGDPTVIFGGFLSYDLLYVGMAEAIEAISQEPVTIVDTRSVDWIGAAFVVGWRRLLDRLSKAVETAAAASRSGRVTLVAHSAGGVLARIYLSPRTFFGRSFDGQRKVSQLITLGSPHYSNGRIIYGGTMSKWANRRYPGAYFHKQVDYVSVAGRSIRGDRHGSRRERYVYKLYKDMVGDGNVWGDGVVPVPSAVLRGSNALLLDDVGHFSGFGTAWYGDEAVVRAWWTASKKELSP